MAAAIRSRCVGRGAGALRRGPGPSAVVDGYVYCRPMNYRQEARFQELNDNYSIANWIIQPDESVKAVCDDGAVVVIFPDSSYEWIEVPSQERPNA